MALHIAHWLARGETVSPLEPSEAMELAKRGTINAGVIFFFAAVVLTAIFGRFFCGWGCHLVALQDLSRWLLEKAGIRPVPLRSRLLLWVPSLAFAYMYFWPMVARQLAGLGWPSLQLELTTRDFWAPFPDWPVALATFLACGFLAVYLLGAKGFCTYACPYGAVFAWADRFSRRRIVVSPACEGSGHCTAVCTSNVRVHEEIARYGQVVDPGCMKCLDCVSVCPNQALSYGPGFSFRSALKQAGRGKPPRSGSSPLPWYEELVLAGGFAATFFPLRGLYGIFPFLYSLGLGACGAYLALVTFLLLSARHLKMRQFQLKLHGHVQTAGYAFLGISLLWAGFLLHSGAVQSQLLWGGWLELRARSVTDQSAEAVRAQARQALERAHRWALLPQPGLVPALARLATAQGDSSALSRALAMAAEERQRLPGDFAAVAEIAIAAWREAGELEAARRVAELWTTAQPNAPRAHVYRIALDLELGQTSRAREAWNEAERVLGPRFPEELRALPRPLEALPPGPSP
jgi:polyferredoxin